MQEFWHTLRREWAHPAYRAGVKALLPGAPGLAAWGMMTGVAMVKSGLSLPETLAMGLLVYAGSAQLAALPLLVAGAPLWVIWAAALCVNLRFVVFSAHLRQFMMHHRLPQRLFKSYLSVDMAYLFFVQAHPKPAPDAQGRAAQDAFYAGACQLSWLAWMLPQLLGVLLAQAIPTHWGLEFAGTLALLGILCGMAVTRLRLLAAAVAGTAAIAAYALPLKLHIVVAIAAAVCVGLMTEALLAHRSQDHAA